MITSSSTIFDTPFLKTILHKLSVAYLKVFRWKKEGQLPDIPKYVMIAAPHTSNWDLVITLILTFAFRIKVFWMGKDAIFRWPFGGICRWLGGIPINRSRSNDTVAQAVDVFHRHDRLVMIVPPEGTRKKVRYWKTGFYYIALGAKVPIVMGYVDYRRKAGGIGPAFMPTGDIDEDMVVIRSFYEGISGRNEKGWSHEGVAVKNGAP